MWFHLAGVFINMSSSSMYANPTFIGILVTAECLSVIKYIVLSLYITSKRVLKKEEQKKPSSEQSSWQERRTINTQHISHLEIPAYAR